MEFHLTGWLGSPEWQRWDEGERKLLATVQPDTAEYQDISGAITKLEKQITVNDESGETRKG
jgi:hypothetical protein